MNEDIVWRAEVLVDVLELKNWPSALIKVQKDISKILFIREEKSNLSLLENNLNQFFELLQKIDQALKKKNTKSIKFKDMIKIVEILSKKIEREISLIVLEKEPDKDPFSLTIRCIVGLLKRGENKEAINTLKNFLENTKQEGTKEYYLFELSKALKIYKKMLNDLDFVLKNKKKKEKLKRSETKIVNYVKKNLLLVTEDINLLLFNIGNVLEVKEIDLH